MKLYARGFKIPLQADFGHLVSIDHLQTSELIWEREDRAPGRADFPLSVDVDEITEDVFESHEEQIPYMFPDRTPPEEK